MPALSSPAVGSDILAGKQAIDGDGQVLTGSIAGRSASDLSASGSSIVVPAGHYPSQVSKSVTTIAQATPTISVSTAGLITAQSTQSAGYISAGTKSATRQLTTQSAQTITPGTTNKTIASGRYLTGTQTIQGDTNLVAGNIKSGVSIFGVAGTLSSGTLATCTIRHGSDADTVFLYWTTLVNGSVANQTYHLQYDDTSTFTFYPLRGSVVTIGEPFSDVFRSLQFTCSSGYVWSDHYFAGSCGYGVIKIN